MSSNIDLTKLRTVAVKAQEAEAAARKQRDALLSRFDSEMYRNPLYWEALSLEQQSSRINYRQLLLDITLQPGFPDVIDWPIKPEF